MFIGFEENNDITIEQSGSVFSFNLEDVRLKLAIDTSDNNPLYLIFKFVHDLNVKDPEVEPIIEGNKLTLLLKNYDNPLGTGTKKPLPLGTVGLKEIFLNFRVLAMNNDSEKLLFYTFYSKPVDVQAFLEKKTAKPQKKPNTKAGK